MFIETKGKIQGVYPEQSAVLSIKGTSKKGVTIKQHTIPRNTCCTDYRSFSYPHRATL